MKKDKEWAFIELGKLFPSHAEIYDHPDDTTVMKCELLNKVYDILSQLDEPETIEETIHLLESVLKENKRLGKLLEEKHEEWLELMDEINNQEKLSQKWIDENKSLINGRSTNPDGTEGDCYDAHYIHVLELQNLLVPKQEKVKVPQFVAEHIEKWKNSNVSLSYALSTLRDELTHFKGSDEQTKNWLYHPVDGIENQELYARAWIDGYKVDVEEEQKYIVSDNSSVPLLIKNDSGEIMSYDSQIAYNNSNGTIELTEQEIKDYDPRYMTFAKPVEELEE